MKKAKRILALILCLLVCAFVCPAVSAAITPKIIISNKSVLPGKEVTLDLSITNNPGIMSMTFSVTYDNSQFEFVNVSKGYISTPIYEDHSDKGYVAFSISETKDKAHSGTIMSLTFKTKEDATPGRYDIRLANHYFEKAGYNLDNCFSNSKEEYIIPTVKTGSITVEETCENAGHKYGGWQTTTQANCTETGTREHTCVRCGNTEEEIIPITHNFEADWTVDKAATPTDDGIMSRHCTKCDEVTDKITFSYEEIGGDDTNDTSSDTDSSDVSSDDTITEDSSNDNTSNDNTSSGDISSDNASNGESSLENNPSDNQTQNDDISSDSSNKKPVINNTVGAKNPLSEVEKLEDYQENIKPDKETANTSSETQSSNQENSSSPDKDISSKDAAADSNDTEDNDKNPSFFSTPTGIVIAVICSLLSIGIIVLGIILIIRNKKSQ